MNKGEDCRLTALPGAIYQGSGHCTFRVWAPLKEKMVLHLLTPRELKIPMLQDAFGYYQLHLEEIAPGTLYYFMPDGRNDYPDPASYAQPEGVHGPSMVVDHRSFKWKDKDWKGIPQKQLIFYELHVGTFTPLGTFEAIIPRLDDLYALGITALELMPVGQFPGERNWGYDGVYPYAIQHSYGGLEGLKKLVDACHQKGIAVFLDVVYNHLGPEGNYLKEFGPYFTDKYQTPWGSALNYDDEWSDGVREYFCGNVLYLLQHFHLDGLRLDAIHTIYDNGAVHFWAIVREAVKKLSQEGGRSLSLIAESDLNSPKVLDPVDRNGFGFDAQWLDDFHHALYVLLDPQGQTFYIDFGSIQQLIKAYQEGFVHSGEFVQARKRKHGTSSAGISGDRFVAFIQNHDQIGNRVHGERLSVLVKDQQKLKVAAAALLLSPYIPLLFMGEEYGEDIPFLYFVSHSDQELIEAVQTGRKEQFKELYAGSEPPDPQDFSTFNDSKIDWGKRHSGFGRELSSWYKQLIQLRREHKALCCFDKDHLMLTAMGANGFSLLRWDEGHTAYMLAVFNLSDQELGYTFPDLPFTWESKFDAVSFPDITVHLYRAGDHVFIEKNNVLVLVSKLA